MNLNSTQKNALSNFKKFVSFRNKISLYLSLIVLCIISTGIYTFIANYFLDKEQEEVLKNLEKEGLIDALQNGKISYKEIL